jgi:site-specific DNA-cytosine methylase
LGDVTKWKEWDLDWSEIGFLFAGSPCQGFSFSGKQLAFDDPRSALFFVFVEIWEHLKKHNPHAQYLLENVRMKKEHEIVISRYMDINPLELNSALLSAQNRERLYWTTIGNQKVGLFGDVECVIPQPKDKGILLRDILEERVDEKYYLSDKMLEYFKNRAKNFNQGKVNIREEDWKASTITASSFKYDISDNFVRGVLNQNGDLRETEKSNCIDANYHKGMDNHSQRTMIHETGCIKFGRTEEAKEVRKKNMSKGKDTTPFQMKEIKDVDYDKMSTLTTAVNKDNLLLVPYGNSQDQKISPTEGKSQTLNAGHFNQPKIIEEKNLNQLGYIGNSNSQANRVYDTEHKSVTLQSSAGGLGAKTGLYLTVQEATEKGYIEVEPGECFDMTMPKSKTRRGRAMKEKSNCMMASKFDFMHYTPDFRIRRLTPRECGRLQTVPEEILDIMLSCGVSDTQLYRMFGNGWTVDAIAYILSFHKKPN